MAGERLLSETDLEQIDLLLDETEVETPRVVSMKVTELRERAGKRVSVLEIGVKVSVPATVEAADIVEMDIVTGQIV